MENYFINKQTEHQKQALDALNRALLWCKQVGIDISYSYANNALEFDKEQILVDDYRVIWTTESKEESEE